MRENEQNMASHLERPIASTMGFSRELYQLYQRRRRRQRGLQENNGFVAQNNNFARASRFFVHFFTVLARLRRENA